MLNGLTEAGLEIHKRLHIEAHRRGVVDPLNHLPLFTGRVQEGEGWKDWSDVEMLRGMAIDVLSEDNRGAEELAVRYKPKETQ